MPQNSFSTAARAAFLLALLAGAAQARDVRPDTTLLRGPSHSAEAVAATRDKVIAAVRAADDERIAATIAGDRARLEAVYSDELHYSHSNGRVDNKASQIQGITAGANRYESLEYKERTFVPVGPGAVVMKGRMLMHIANKQTGEKSTNDLNYLAVWREENGKWRFFAWQSCRNPPPAAK